jgi:tol-pal system protein YbgF
VKSNPTIIILLVLTFSIGCGKREKVFSAREYFDQGAEYFRERSFALGALEFQKVLEKYPESEWADNAQFGLGLIYEELGDYQKAVEELGKVVINYPKGDKASNALFGTGEIYERRLKNNSQAIETYRKLVDNYPGSRWAPMARERIERLRKEEKR